VAQRRDRPVSIRDVARASGVSLTTVSLVLNGTDKRISQSTRERVLAAIRELGYRPNRLAQGLQNRRSRIVGVLVPPFAEFAGETGLGDILAGIHEAALDNGYRMLVEAASGPYIESRRYVELFEQCFVDALIVFGCALTPEAESGDGGRDPVIHINEPHTDSSVRLDYASAAERAVRHLRELGHQEIGVLAMSGTSGEMFVQAVANALARGPQPRVPAQIRQAAPTRSGGAAVVEMHRASPQMTGLIVQSSDAAIGAITALRLAGIEVPRQISLVACEDQLACSRNKPAITTTGGGLFDLGRTAALTALRQVREREPSSVEILDGMLHARASSGPPPTA